MAFWLVKSEPGDWSWEDQLGVTSEPWDGVRNFQAQKNMRAMQVGNQVFFYHSGKSREIVGVCTVVRAQYPDPSDDTGKFILVDLKADYSLDVPVSLSSIKANEKLSHIALVRQSRLSVMPLDEASWMEILSMSKER